MLTQISKYAHQFARNLAKEGMENARDRLQCTKRYTQYLSVLFLSNLTNHFRYGIWYSVTRQF